MARPLTSQVVGDTVSCRHSRAAAVFVGGLNHPSKSGENARTMAAPPMHRLLFVQRCPDQLRDHRGLFIDRQPDLTLGTRAHR
jgi:hypothetical protein